MKETLDTLIKKLKSEHNCKHYKEYDENVQEMVQKLYNATYRVGLFQEQIAYVIDQALEPFERVDLKKRIKTY